MKKRFLNGGRGPRIWRLKMAQAAEPLRTFRRSLAWLRTFAAERPRLRDEPLFGRSLAELALQEAPVDSPPAQPARSARPRGAPAGDRVPRSERISESLVPSSRRGEGPATPTPAGRSGPSHRPALSEAPRPLSLEPRASLDLLTRRAGPASDRRSGPRYPQYPQNSRAELPGPSEVRPARSAPVQAAEAQPPKARQEWLRDLARRARRVLHRDLRHPSAAASAEPWEITLQGEEAPIELLKRRSAAPRPADSRRSSPSQALSQAPSQASSQAPSQASSPAPKTTGGPSGPASRTRPPAPATALADAETDAPVAAPPPHPGPAGDVPSPTSDAPGLPVASLLEAALPPLLPPRDTGAPSPWKAPAQAPALVGRREAETAEEDLGRLAANLQRILAEEARRHGIDV